MAEYHVAITELPEGERPRERLVHYGPQALSDAELIAILLRTGNARENAVSLAQRMIGTFRGVRGLGQASVAELCEVNGIGPAKAVQIKAALELGRRSWMATDDPRPQISGPKDAARILQAHTAGETQEQLWVLLLDSKHYVMRSVRVYVGNVNTSVIRVGEVYREAVRDNALAIVVGHNHPSGDPTPSSEDVSVTRELVRAGEMLDIKLLDHVVVAGQRHVSMKERGLGF